MFWLLVNFFLCVSINIHVIANSEIKIDTAKFNLRVLENKKNIIPVAIIGGGPAGFCAGMYTARAHMPTVIFMGPLPGGQLTTTSVVENWPAIKKKLGHEIMIDAQTQAEESGAVIKYETIENVDFSSWPFKLYSSEGQEWQALTVIIATGASPRKLGLPEESRYWGKGISSCAVCDCLFFKDKKVFVVGGGDVAMEHIMQLSPYAQSVTVLVRGDRMRATPLLQDKLKDYTNVAVLYNTSVTKIIGDGNNLTHLEINNAQTKQYKIVEADGLFLAIGQNPNTHLFKSALPLRPDGYIQVNMKTQETACPGVFAAGDVQDSDYRQAVIALADGCKAAFNAIGLLRHIGCTESFLKKLSLFK
jgi:thioredoxin reductase (NADPH)